MKTNQAQTLRFGLQVIQRTHPLLQIIGASLFVALCSQIRIPLFFTPVHISLQTLSVMLVGGILGSKKGALSLIVYLCEAAAGLPVLAGWRSEPLAFFTPLGGYLFGFVLQAYITGWIIEKRPSISFGNLILALSCGSALQLGFGSLYLAYFVGWESCFMLGFYPFVPVEPLKILTAAAYLRSCHSPGYHNRQG